MQAYLGADMIVANSAATLAVFSTSFGPPRLGIVAYLGVDPKWFAPVEEPFEHPALAALAADSVIISSVGRIEDRKGQLETVGLLARAQSEPDTPRFVYVIVGRPEQVEYTDQISAEAAALNVEVVFAGRLSDDDLARLYARSLCHVLCARPLSTKIEGFGLVLIEAGAQGCPSITTRIGGIPEVVGEESALLFDADDFGGMARMIARLAREPATRAAHSVACRDRAQTFTWQSCAEHAFPDLMT